jgi:hypothetical protein
VSVTVLNLALEQMMVNGPPLTVGVKLPLASVVPLLTVVPPPSLIVIAAPGSPGPPQPST